MPEPESGNTSDNKPDMKPADEDPDLSLVIEMWEKLPEAIRTAILALVRTAEQRPSDDEKQQVPSFASCAYRRTYWQWWLVRHGPVAFAPGAGYWFFE